ncbi:hypothetical protein F5J12DRAFT_785811 [Pisolithus orientalis]|uniref:uncharacterized protein n=1 Tax=Pisolithus orientalis TaxID=936130 RepID=UPI0022249D34|nr:uncharacterized protein F5J12DRAFT_785811 [Pisolithus orientalis]KAI5994247.1 hypothetical protein F5J12DRAFT_785811 [Pisolithus orientalis]
MHWLDWECAAGIQRVMRNVKKARMGPRKQETKTRDRGQSQRLRPRVAQARGGKSQRLRLGVAEASCAKTEDQSRGQKARKAGNWYEGQRGPEGPAGDWSNGQGGLRKASWEPVRSGRARQVMGDWFGFGQGCKAGNAKGRLVWTWARPE